MPAPDVALVTPYPPSDPRRPVPTGVATYSRRLARALDAQGARVTVLAPQEPDEPRQSRDGGIRVERPYRRGAAALPAAAASAIATGAPAVHLQHELFLFGGPWSVPGLAPALGRLRARRRAAVVTMHHVVDPARVDPDFTRIHRVRAPAAVARVGLAGVQRVIRRLASAVVVHEPVFTDVVPGARVVPHGIDRPGSGDRGAARARLGVAGDDLMVLCFGFLAPYKGLELALDAAAMARPAVRLVVAGGQHPRLAANREPYAERLRERAPDHAVFTGYVPDADVPGLYAAADVALLLYPQPFAASGPLALALANGLPLVASPALAAMTGAPPECSVPLEAAAVARRLDFLAAEPARRGDLARASRSLAEQRTWPAVARSHLELYSEVTP